MIISIDAIEMIYRSVASLFGLDYIKQTGSRAIFIVSFSEGFLATKTTYVESLTLTRWFGEGYGVHRNSGARHSNPLFLWPSRTLEKSS